MIQVRNVQALSEIWCKPPPQPPTLRPLSHTNTFPTNFQFDQNFICRSYQCRGFVSVHIEIHGSTSWECISHEHCIVRDGVSIIWEESLQLNYLIASAPRFFSWDGTLIWSNYDRSNGKSTWTKRSKFGWNTQPSCTNFWTYNTFKAKFEKSTRRAV